MKNFLDGVFYKGKIIGFSIVVGSTPAVYALDKIQDDLRPQQIESLRQHFKSQINALYDLSQSSESSVIIKADIPSGNTGVDNSEPFYHMKTRIYYTIVSSGP